MFAKLANDKRTDEVDAQQGWADAMFQDFAQSIELCDRDKHATSAMLTDKQ